MNPLPEIAGAAGGGLLGQIGDAISMPRRALWGGIAGLMGQDAPESGADLLHSLSGGAIDKESLLGQGLGFGAEVLGDPLTYAGGLLGRLLGAGKMARSGLMTKASLAPGAIAEAAPGIGTKATPLADLLEGMIGAEEGGKTIGFRDVLASRRKTPMIHATGEPAFTGGVRLEGQAGPSMGALEPDMFDAYLRTARNAIENKRVLGVYTHPNVPPASGPTGVIAINRPDALAQGGIRSIERHELSHALTNNAPSGTARGILGEAQTGVDLLGDGRAPIAKMIDEALAQGSEAAFDPATSSINAEVFMKAGADPYLRQFGLNNTPYENFVKNIAPEIMQQVGRDKLTHKITLLDYLRPMAAKAREMKLGLAAPLAGGGGLAALLGNNNDA